jgi:ABC-2 type transport system permease protein
MKIFITTLKYEWKSLNAGNTPLILSSLLFLLLAYSFYQSHQHQNKIKVNIEQALLGEQEFYQTLKSEAEQIEAGKMEAPAWFNDPRDPYRAGFIRGAGVHIYKPPAFFSSLAVGQSDIYPHAIKVPSDESVSDLENPYNLALGFFDPAFVLTFLLPLFIIGLSYNIISAEREQGTLRLLMSQPISVLRVFVPKICVRLLFIVALVLSLVLINQWVFGAEGSGSFMGWFYLFGAIILYAVFWFSLALTVNLAGYSSANNLVVLFGFWLLFTVLVPTLTNLIATNVHKVPSRVEYVNTLRSAGQEAATKRDEILAKYYGDERELFRKDMSLDDRRKTTLENLAITDYANTIINKKKEEYNQQLNAQQALADRYIYGSPAMLFYRALTVLAETDRSHYEQLETTAEQFTKDWKMYFQNLYESGLILKASDYESFPSYEPSKHFTSTNYPLGFLIGLFGFLGLTLIVLYVLRNAYLLAT